MKITHRTLILFIALIIVIVFSSSLKNDFSWDDHYLIVNNPYLRVLDYLPKIFTTQLYEASEVPSNYYRPFQLLSFYIDYSIWGLNPFGYHLTNLLLHIFNSILVYLLIAIISSSSYVAFLTALLFGIAPAISGVTFYISARSDLLMGAFIFLSILFFIKYTKENKKPFYFISIVSFIFSLLSKEVAMILPFLLILQVFWNSKEKKAQIISLLPFFFILSAYIFLRMGVLNFTKGSNPAFASSISLTSRILTDFNVVVTYIRFLLLPLGLHMQRFIKPAQTLLEINVILPLLIIIFLVFIVQRFSLKNKIFLYGAIWFFISLLPVLNIYPVSLLLHEMWLYIPSVGFFIILSIILQDIIKPRVGRIFSIVFVILFLVYYAIFTISYGKTWRDSISVFRNALKYEAHNPFSDLIYNNLATEYYNRGEFKKAIVYCKWSISLTPNCAELYNNLGIFYTAMGKKIMAINFFKKAINLKKDYLEAYCNLAHAYDNIGLKDSAIEVSNFALKMRPDSYKIYSNLGYIYGTKGEIDKAIEFFKKAIELRAEYGQSHYLLGNLYIKKNRLKEALLEYEKAKALEPCDFNFYNMLAFLYIKNNKFMEAERSLLYSLMLNNNQSEPHNNLGNMYTMFGHFDLATREYQKALSMDPGNIRISDNIEKTKLKWKEALAKSNIKN